MPFDQNGNWVNSTPQFNYNYSSGAPSVPNFQAPQYNFSQYGATPVAAAPRSFALPDAYKSLGTWGAPATGIDPSVPTGDWTSDPTVPGSSVSSYNYGTNGVNGAPGTNGVQPPAVAAAGQPLGWNMGTAQIALGGLQAVGNIYSAFEQAAIAKDSLAFTKKIGNANLANQMKSYNTNLTDKANMNSAVGGWTPDQTSAYVNKNQLTGK